MTGEAYICKLGHLKEIPGADNIVESHIMGETVIISKDCSKDDLGVLFDCETQLSEEFCKFNNLYSDPLKNADTEKKGYLSDKRRVRPIKLRGVKCSAFWMPISSLEFAGPISIHSPGDEFNEVFGVHICNKYIPPRNTPTSGKGKPRNSFKFISDMFLEHMDTAQLGRNVHRIQPDDLITVTEKLHGTSMRVGNLKYKRKPTLVERVLIKLGVDINLDKWGLLVGSRRVLKSVQGEDIVKANSYYKEDVWTLAAKRFEGKLRKGETVYAEIVGYLPTGAPIMGTQGNEKLKGFMEKDEYKAFKAKYGASTTFSYGCDLDFKPFDVYVYRITQTNEDGQAIDYTHPQVIERCEQLEVNAVPLLVETKLAKEYFEFEGADSHENIINLIEEFRESKTFPEHIMEGVCVRIDNGKSLTPTIFKHKSFIFKVLEGIVKDQGIISIEEQEDGEDIR